MLVKRYQHVSSLESTVSRCSFAKRIARPPEDGRTKGRSAAMLKQVLVDGEEEKSRSETYITRRRERAETSMLRFETAMSKQGC